MKRNVGPLDIFTHDTPVSKATLRRVGTARLVRHVYRPGTYPMEGVLGYQYWRIHQPLPCNGLERKEGSRWKVWMVDDPLHWFGMREFVNRLPGGHIVCAGLGLGLMAHHLVERDDVDRIEIVEIDPDVIELIRPTLPEDKRIVIRQANFYALLKQGEFKKVDGILWDLAVGDRADTTIPLLIGAALIQVHAPGVPYVRFGDKSVLQLPVHGRPAEPPPLAPVPPPGRSGRDRTPRARLGRQRASARPSPPTVPPRRAHPAGCKHQWCYCYDSEHAEAAWAARAAETEIQPCRICRTDAFNRRKRDERERL